MEQLANDDRDIRSACLTRKGIRCYNLEQGVVIRYRSYHYYYIYSTWQLLEINPVVEFNISPLRGTTWESREQLTVKENQIFSL